MNKNLLILGFVFFFTFLGFASVQQFITSYFTDIWYENAWFHSLLLLYTGFFVWNLFLVWLIKKIGSKNSMLVSTLIYGLFIFSLLFDNLILLYFSSFIIGISAAFLWVWQQSYIILALDWKNIWKYIGYINIFLFLWASVGSWILWKLIELNWYKESFFIYAFFPLIAMILVLFLKDYSEWELEKSENKFSMFKYFKNIDLLKLWFFYFSLSFSIWLYFSIVPIHIKESLWISYIWIISFFYYFIVMLLSYFLWKQVDKYNNKILIFILSFWWLISMWLLYFYSYNNLFIFTWIFVLSVTYSVLSPLIWSIINKISIKNNIKYLSSFFFIFSNLWLVLGILFSSYIKSNLVYLVAFLLILLSMSSYYTLYRKSFTDIKKGI